MRKRKVFWYNRSHIRHTVVHSTTTTILVILPTPKQREIIVWHCWDLSAWHKVRSQRHHRVYHSPYITLPISGTKQYQNSELFYISAFLPIFPISCMWHLQSYGTSSCGHLWGGGNRLLAWDQLDWQRDWLFSEDGDQCVSFWPGWSRISYGNPRPVTAEPLPLSPNSNRWLDKQLLWTQEEAIGLNSPKAISSWWPNDSPEAAMILIMMMVSVSEVMIYKKLCSPVSANLPHSKWTWIHCVTWCTVISQVGSKFWWW